MMAMLRDWWRRSGMPGVEHLPEDQARLVLDHIAEMEWGGRPFTEEETHG